MKREILICGSSKNLGKFLVKKFSKKFKIFSLSSSLKPDDKLIFQNNFVEQKELIKTMKKIKKNSKNINSIIFTVGKSNKTNGKLNDYKESFDVNFFSFVNLINAYLEVFKYKKIKIIVIASIAGVKRINAPVEYSVSKSALIYYCKIMSKKLINFGISINIISPGNILMKNNNWGKKMSQNKKQVLKYIKENVPSNRFIKPDEIYDICKFIIENKNTNLVGSNIIIDGGQSL